MKSYAYSALAVRQTTSAKHVILFAAPATEIDRWAGIPQKKRFGTGESVGFQREENEKRVDSLGEFCANDDNIIQNPLLCATRRLSVASTRFEPHEGQSGDSQQGTFVIQIPDYGQYSMEKILGLVREYVEARHQPERPHPAAR